MRHKNNADVQINIEALHSNAKIDIDKDSFLDMITEAVSAGTGRDSYGVTVQINISAVHDHSSVTIF